MKTINLKEKFNSFSDHWNQRLLGVINDCAVKIVKVKGVLRMKFRDHEAVIREGEFVIVPHGVEHCPVADEEVHLVLIEPKSTLNTGNIVNERTAAPLEQI
jgi:hypothetical protein